MRVLPHERRCDPLERLDATLFAAVGLFSVIARFDALLERHGRPAAASAPRTARPVDAEDDRLLMALVGLVALKRACGAHVEALAADGRATRPSSAPADEAPIRRTAGSLLR